jgi:23S rRNA (uracil1939-C5)-methyltransferase
MIPWSNAIEALAWFAPGAPPPPRVLHETEAFLAVEKAPHETVSSRGADGPSLQARVRQLPDWQDAQPLDAWGAEVSGVCWFAKSATLAAKLTAERTASGASRPERSLSLLTRGTLRKQGTIARRGGEAAGLGSRYKKLADAGRHAWVTVLTHDAEETGTLRDFAGIGHPVLGDAVSGDAASNQFLEHRHGLDRLFVHCTSSRLRVDAETVLDAHSVLSPDLSRVLASLGSD